MEAKKYSNQELEAIGLQLAGQLSISVYGVYGAYKVYEAYEAYEVYKAYEVYCKFIFDNC